MLMAIGMAEMAELKSKQRMVHNKQITKAEG